MNIGTIEAVLSARDEFTATLTRASQQLQKVGSQAQKIGSQMASAGTAMTVGITAPIALIGGGAVKAFADFDHAMTKSLAIMGDAAQAMRGDMAEAAREVARTTVPSAKEAADAYYFLASAGLDAATSMAALPKVAKFAQAGAFDMARATDLLTDAQSALGLTIRDNTVKNMENLTRVSDVLVKANTLANASVEQFSTALTREAGAALKSFNIDVEEGVAVLAAFADQGVKGEMAGTGLSRVLRLMTAGVDENREAYEKYNVEVFDAQGNINNLADIIQDLEVAFKDMSDEQRVAALEALGFQARVQGIILPLIGTSNAIRRYNNELKDAAGTTEEVARRQMESFTNQMKLVKDALMDAAITLGSSLAPAIRQFVEGVVVPLIAKMAALAEWFSNWPDGMKKAAIAAAALLAAAGPVVFVLGQMVMAAGALATVMPGVTGAFIALASPMGLLVAGVGALVLGITHFIAVQNQLHKDTLTNVEAVQKYGMVINDLRKEMGEAARAQRDLDIAIIESAGRALPRMRADLEAARDKLARLHEEAKRGPWGGLINQISGTNSKIREQESVVADLEGKVKATNSMLIATADTYIELSGAVERATSGSGGGGGGLVKFREEVEQMAASLQSNLMSSQQLLSAYSSQAVSLDQLTISAGSTAQQWEALNMVFDGTVTSAEVAAANLDELALAAVVLGDRVESVGNSMGGVVDLTQGAATAFRSNAVAIDNNQQAYALLRQTTVDYARTQDEVLRINRELMSAMATGVITTEQFEAAWERVNTVFEINTEVSAKWGDAFAEAIATAIVNADDLGDALKDLFVGQAKQSMVTFITEFQDGFNFLHENGVSTFKSLAMSGKAAMKNLAETTDPVSVAFAAATGDWASMGIGALTAISKFAQGDWVGAMIAAVGVVIGAFKKLFGSSRNWKKEIQETFGAIKDGQVTVNDFNAAVSLMSELLTRAEKGLHDVDKVSKTLNEEFDALFEAALKMGDAGVDAIARIVAEAKAAGVDMTAIQEKLDEMLDQAAQQIAERTAFLQDQAQIITQSIEDLFTNTGNVSAKNVRFAATSVMQAFEALVAAGTPILEIMEQLGSSFTLVGERAAELGISLPAEFERFGEMLDILGREKIQNLVGRLEAVGSAAQAAANLGLLTAEQFDRFGDQLDRTFKRLKAGGLTSEESLAALAPQLQMLQDMSEQYGYQLDRQTQKLVDQAKAQGLVTEKGLTTEDILIRGFDAMIEATNRLIVALGGVPVEFQSIGDSAEEAADQIITSTTNASTEAQQAIADLEEQQVESAMESFVAWDDMSTETLESVMRLQEETNDQAGLMIDHMGFAADASKGAWDDALHGIAGTAQNVAGQIASELSHIPISFDVSVNGPGGGGQGGPGHGNLEYQHGSGEFMEFGAGTPAVLHGREQVVTVAQGKSIAEMVAYAIRDAGKGMTGGSMTNEQELAVQKAIEAGIRSLRDEFSGLRRDMANRAQGAGDPNWRSTS